METWSQGQTVKGNGLRFNSVALHVPQSSVKRGHIQWITSFQQILLKTNFKNIHQLVKSLYQTIKVKIGVRSKLEIYKIKKEKRRETLLNKKVVHKVEDLRFALSVGAS